MSVVVIASHVFPDQSEGPREPGRGRGSREDAVERAALVVFDERDAAACLLTFVQLKPIRAVVGEIAIITSLVSRRHSGVVEMRSSGE